MPRQRSLYTNPTPRCDFPGSLTGRNASKMRSKVSSLSQSINKVSKINNKKSYDELIKKFPNTYQLCNHDRNKFELLLRKGVYPYKYMESWERFEEESLPDKKSFYSELNKEGISDEDYARSKSMGRT